MTCLLRIWVSWCFILLSLSEAGCCKDETDLDHFAFATNRMIGLHAVSVLSTSQVTIAQCARACRQYGGSDVRHDRGTDGRQNGGQDGWQNGGQDGWQNGGQDGRQNGSQDGWQNGGQDGRQNGSQDGWQNGGQFGGSDLQQNRSQYGRQVVGHGGLQNGGQVDRQEGRRYDGNNGRLSVLTGNGNHSQSCDSFEYVWKAGVCVLLNTRTETDGRLLFSELRPAEGTSFYELGRSPTSLFTLSPGQALAGNKDYYCLLNVTSSDKCADKCVESPDFTCNSFAYSTTRNLCALSRFTVAKEHRLMVTKEYDFYQYSGEWPCNVTILWNYSPRTFATAGYPFVPKTPHDCYIILVAPPKKRVILTVKALYGHHTLCHDEKSGLFVYGGVDGPLRICRNISGNGLDVRGDVDRNLTVMMVQGKSRFLARMTYHYSKHIGYRTLSLRSAYLLLSINVATTRHFLWSDVNTVCSETIEYCEGDHCLNGGTCRLADGETTCYCGKGHTGQRCETEVDNCSSRPCLFHGHCLNKPERYTCDCLPGTKEKGNELRRISWRML